MIGAKKAGGPGRSNSPLYLIGGVTAVNLLLAAVSFMKDLSFASYFGTSRAADQVNTAFLLPEAISYNLIAIVIGIAAVPELTRRWQERRYGQFLRGAVRLTLHIALAMIAIGIMLALLRTEVFTLSGYPSAGVQTERLERMYLLLLATLPLFPAYAAGAAALQASGAFYAAAAGPIVLNALMLAAIAGSAAAGVSEGAGELGYAFAILAGAAGMALLVWISLRRRLRAETGRSLRTVWKSKDDNLRGERSREGLRSVYRGMLPLLLLTLFSQAQYAAERMIASNQASGTLAALNYAYRISQFPVWVFMGAIAAVLLPSISRVAMQEKSRTAKPELLRALRGTLLMTVPVSAILCLFRGPIVELLFGRGAFDERSVALTSSLLAGYSLSAVGQAVSGILVRYLIAYGRLSGAAIASFASAAAAVVIDWIAVPSYGAAAIGYGSFIGWALNVLLLTGIVQRHSRVWRGSHVDSSVSDRHSRV